MSFIVVPKGKKVRFKQGQNRSQRVPGTEGIDLFLEEDVTLTMSSNFGSIHQGNSPVFLSLASQQLSRLLGTEVGGYLSGQFKQFGFQTWTGTEPLTATLTLTLTMKNDAYKEVIVPAMSLAKLCLPSENASGGLVGPGPAISEALQNAVDEEDLEDVDDDAITAGRNLHCWIGNYLLKNIIVTRAQPTFSRHVDNRGYPISARIEIGISTLFSATSQMVNEILQGK